MKSLLGSIGSSSSGTLISRILGFTRDVVIARAFGAGALTDAFFVAFRIPNLFRRLFAEGAFSLAFVPVLSEYRERGDKQAIRDLIDSVTGCLLAILLIVTTLGVLLAPLIIGWFAPGFDVGEQRYLLASEMLRITFPYLLFISLTALAGGILNSWERFWVPAVTPALLNLSLITAALLLAPQLEVPIMALAWGVLAAGIIQLLFQVPALRRLQLLPRPRLKPSHAGVKQIFKLMLPVLFGSSVGQINLVINTILASLLFTGSVSWLYYSDRLVELPVGVFGVALATVLLPRLSRQATAINNGATDRVTFQQTLQWGMRWAILISLPAAAGLCLLAEPLMQGLFEYGEFSQQDAFMSSLALAVFAGALPAFISIKVLAPAYYSRQDTRSPVRYAVISIVANIIFNIGLLYLGMHLAGFRGDWQSWLDGLSRLPGLHVALAAASTLAAWLNAALLWNGLRRQGWWVRPAGWWWLVVRIVIAVTAMCLALWWLQSNINELDTWLGGSWWQRVLALVVLVGSGAICYFIGLMVLGLRPRHILQNLGDNQHVA